MADVKWIKIVTDIFDDEKMYAIETLQDGYLIEVVWLKLLCLAGKCNQSGFLMVNRKLAYTDEMLAKIFRMDLGTVKRALEIFERLEMIEVVENAYMVSNWTKYQNHDRLEEMKAKHRESQKRYREKQKAMLEDKKSDVTSDVTNDVICSYSYSNNSNISNLLYFLKDYKDISYLENNIVLLDAIKEWFSYKDSKKPKSANHYTEISIKKLLNKIIKADGQYGTEAVVNLIEECISNNWQGIIWDKLETKPTQDKKQGFLERWENA